MYTEERKLYTSAILYMNKVLYMYIATDIILLRIILSPVFSIVKTSILPFPSCQFYLLVLVRPFGHQTVDEIRFCHYGTTGTK